ncbi:hypothetical protein FRAHR75_530012 [Frankia sp. Hr75.2]|nr:hypothetical protein FRAHR75_530012 [Frankia sp. Hr75.2]
MSGPAHHDTGRPCATRALTPGQPPLPPRPRLRRAEAWPLSESMDSLNGHASPEEQLGTSQIR